MYTLKDIDAKITLGHKAGLSGVHLLADDPDRAIRVCNGIGADWMPDVLREAISTLNPTLVLAADIHDIRYLLGGTEADRKAADDEMLANGIKLADWRYRWCDPRRYYVRKQIHKFHAILRVAGGAAFNYHVPAAVAGANHERFQS